MPIQPSKIREARDEKEFSLSQLAFEISKAVGRLICRQTVHGWEQGIARPNSANLDALAQVTGKSIAFFYGEEVGVKSTPPTRRRPASKSKAARP
jgi:transcriptional regulator with XRE-family HTH domain